MNHIEMMGILFNYKKETKVCIGYQYDAKELSSYPTNLGMMDFCFDSATD